MKTSDLIDLALDFAVAKAQRVSVAIFAGTLRVNAYGNAHLFGPEYSPSTNWAQGGPIIEREQIEIAVGRTEGWAARKYNNPGHSVGPTPLIAAMRCYVASKLGDEVEIPDELQRTPA